MPRGAGDLSLTRLGDLDSFPDPLLTFKWVCTSLPFNHNVKYVESIDLPFLNINIGDKAHVAASYLYYPSTHDINSFSMSFYEDSNGASLKWLLGWKSQIKDFKTGLYKLPGNGSDGYKQTITIKLLDTANNVVLIVDLIGVWPADTGNLSLNYTDVNGRVVITQTFSIDDQKINFNY